MNWVENLLIVAGISLDIFGAMECQGSLVNKVNKKLLSGICVLMAVCQLIALFLGHFLSDLFCKSHPMSDERFLGEILAMVIFFGLGIRLIVKAIRNERVEEHLETNLGIHRFVRLATVSSLYTVLAGIAFGFVGTNLVAILIMIVVITIAFVIGGMYTGYHMGFTSKTTVYTVGAILLWIAGIDVLLQRVLSIF
ncbi:MAG: manganese efflux pump [Agathobacter sp.]|nr:manganese efflux pump [Agathobacter sp.]